MSLPVPPYLHPPPFYQVLFTIANPAVPDLPTVDPAGVPASRRFNPDRAPYVELYWDVAPIAAGDKATFQLLRWDGIAGVYAYASLVADVAPKTAFQVATGGSTFMAVLVTSITALGPGAANVRVHAAQYFLHC